MYLNILFSFFFLALRELYKDSDDKYRDEAR